MIITIILIIILLVSIHHYYLHYGKRGRLLNLIPGPLALPVLGNILHLNVPNEKLLQRLCELHNQYYPLIRIWLCHLSLIVIRHPDDMKAILDSLEHIEKSDLYKLFHPWVQTGLITSGGSKWHTRRKILTPTFHFNMLSKFVDVFVEESNRMVMTLKNVGGPAVKELIPFVSEHTLNVICETTMGMSLTNSTASKNYRDAVHKISKIFVYRIPRIWLHIKWIFALLPIGRKQRKVSSILYSFTNKIIEERKQYHESTDGRYLRNSKDDTSAEVDDTEISGSKKRQFVMLDLLIAASQENNMTDSDIQEEINTFIAAGYDTTTMGISFALMLLAEHKDIQDCVRLEVDNMIKENGNKFTMSSLQKLPYLDRCLKETMRLYPPVPFIGRVTTKDVKLQSYTVPAGTQVFLHFYAMHRDPTFWPNPEIFDPDRFLPERSNNRHSFSYLPFSAGLRNCIGQRYALLELKSIIASVLHNFYLEPITYLKDVKLEPNIVLCPTSPVYVRFVPIESNN